MLLIKYCLKRGDTLAFVKATMQNLDDYDPEDLDRALEKWGDPNEMVCDVIYYITII
jgi:hypothetical protein